MSPIKGISETRRLPRLGKLHIGVKKKKVVNGREVTYPSAVDYFVFPDPTEDGLSDQLKDLYSALPRVFGEKPKELRILIPVEDEERWASQYYRAYSQTRGLICKGDGDTALRMVDIHTGALANRNTTEAVLKEVPCAGRDCPDYEQSCREIMNLQFLLPEVPGLGIWQIDTSSINSIRNINSAADLVRRIYGKVSMVPLLLTIEPQEVQDSEGKKRTANVLNLRTNRTLLEMMEAISKPTPQMLTDGETEMPVPDDEVPEMVIPQAQEEKVTAEPAKAKRQAKQAETAQTPAEKTERPTDDNEVATPEDKRKLVNLMREKGLADEQMREILHRVTGKTGSWSKGDLAKVEQSLKEETKSAEAEADDFLKEFESQDG
jgi:hypothetical protein